MMMDLFRDRLADGFNIVFSGNDGPITLADEAQFERETIRTRSRHDREDMCLIQLVLFPPIEIKTDEERPNKIKISTFHVATEIWIEPRRGRCKTGPPGSVGKDFLQISHSQMSRDHKMILFDTTYNMIKTQCKQNKPWNSEFLLKDNPSTLEFNNCSGLKEVPKRYLDYSLNEDFENRMNRIFYIANTLDIGILFYHGVHKLFGFSLLEPTGENKDTPNPGNEVLLHQFHEVLQINSDVTLVNETTGQCPVQTFLCKVLKIDRRAHHESESTTTDNNFEGPNDDDYEDEEFEDADEKANSAVSFEGINVGSTTTVTMPRWSVYAKYIEEDDTIILTALPQRLSDISTLERYTPQVFEKISPLEPDDSDFTGALDDEVNRLRKNSETSYGRSSYSEINRHRCMLPVLVTIIDKAKVRLAVNNREEISTNVEVINKCWTNELITSMRRQESVRYERSHSFSPFVPKSNLGPSGDDPVSKYCGDLEEYYNRSFVRGVYHTLVEKSSSSAPPVSATDFHIALYEHCVPEEKKIVITEAILSWCSEWRSNFDEQMRQNEATGDNLDDLDDEVFRNKQFRPRSLTSISRGSDETLNSPKSERARFFITDIKDNDSLDDRSPPPQLRNRSIDVNTPRRQLIEQDERETATKCTELLYEYIGHYFREFGDDEEHECSTFYFVEPDYSHGEYSPQAENFPEDRYGRDNEDAEDSDNGEDIVFEQIQPKEEQKTSITDFDVEQISCEAQLLATVTDDEPQANLSDLTNAESDRSNLLSFQLEDEPTLHQPLFLQLEMQIWAAGDGNRRFSGEAIPLRKDFFTSIQRLVQKVNEFKREADKINRVRLDDIKVELVFSFFTIPTDAMFSDGSDTCDDNSNCGKIPLGFEDKIEKTLDSIKMVIQDEIVAARRKQGIITSEILDLVIDHVGNNESTCQSKVTNRHNLMCNARQVPLKFVNWNEYEESIQLLKENLLRHGYFGHQRHGFSLPSSLFDYRDGGPDLFQDFQFDLKSEGKYFYVTLTPRKGQEEHGSEADMGSIQSSTGNKNSSHASLAELNNTLEADLTLPIFGEDPPIFNEEDREVQHILSREQMSSKRGSRSQLAHTPVGTNSSSSQDQYRISGESSGVRRMSQYRDDPDESKVPNFWLVLEIDSIPEDELVIEDEREDFSWNPMRDTRPGNVPVMKLYHHRRRADNPFAVKIQGEKISYGTGHDDTTCDQQLREPNVTDADEKFINEIENYIRSIVRKVNQLFLLNLLYSTLECHPFLVESEYHEDVDLIDNFSFVHGEFALDQIFIFNKHLHPRITKRQKGDKDTIAVTNLKRRFMTWKVKNRQNMFVNMFRALKVPWSYFFIDRYEEDRQPTSINQRTISMESAEELFRAENLSSGRRLSSSSTCSVLRLAKPCNPSNVSITVHGLTDDVLDRDVRQCMAEFERKIDLVLYNATLQALTTNIHRNKNELLSSDDIEFLQPRSADLIPVEPNFCYFFPIHPKLFEHFRRFQLYLTTIQECSDFQVFMTSNHIQYETHRQSKLSVPSADAPEGKHRKKDVPQDTPFLRHNSSVKSELTTEEVIIFNSCLKKRIPKVKPNRTSTAQHAQAAQDPTQAKIAVISYEVYHNNELLKGKNIESKIKSQEISYTEADEIIFSESMTDEKLKEDMEKFKERGYNFETPTIVFCMWMQDYREKQSTDYNVWRPNVHGVQSMAYKSISGLVRSAIFDSLMELVVLHQPVGMKWDKSVSQQEPRRNGAKTSSKDVAIRKRRDTLNSSTDSRSFQKKAFQASSDSIDEGSSKSRAFSFLKDKNEKVDSSQRKTEIADIESGITGALHFAYEEYFRKWIRKEVDHPTVNFVDFESRLSIRIPSWKIFEKSCLQPIRDKFADLWSKASNTDDQENVCRVFYRDRANVDFIPQVYWRDVRRVPGQRIEFAMFLREPTSSYKGTRKYAKLSHCDKISPDDKELTRQSCALLTLENQPEKNPTLRLYVYNVTENLFDQMSDFIKSLMTAQFVRYEWLTAMTKLKLGLIQPKQHISAYHRLPLGIPGLPLGIPEHRKSKKCYDYSDVYHNNIANLQKCAPDHNVFINQACGVYQSGNQNGNIPKLENDGDPVTIHIRQFLQICGIDIKKDPDDNEDSRLQSILNDWSETTKEGRTNDAEISQDDLKLFKTFSMVKHHEVQQLWLKDDRSKETHLPTRRQTTRRRRRTPPGGSEPQIRARAGLVTRRVPPVTSRRVNALGAQAPVQFDRQLGRRKQQQGGFFEVLEAYVRNKFSTVRMVNTYDTKTSPKCSLCFQLCMENDFAILVELSVDLEKTHTASFMIFALNLALTALEEDTADYCKKLSTIDSLLQKNIDKFIKDFNFLEFLAQFHLAIVHKVWSDYYELEIKRMGRHFAGSIRGEDSLFPSNFDYPNYLQFLKEQGIKEHLVNADFNNGGLVVPYNHNIPAKDFFKVRVSFFKYLVKDSTHDQIDFDAKPIQFVELRTERRLKDSHENRSYILLQREYDGGAYKAVGIIYHDDNESSIEEVKQLKLAYWIVAVRNPEMDSDMTFADAIDMIKTEVISREAGLPKLFDNVGEKCYKDHLWNLQKKGKATLPDLKELLNNADVAVIEISHEADERLKSLTRLGRQWLNKLGDFIKNECSEDRIQVQQFEEKGKCRHLAIFNQSGDYSILILLTVSENDEETRIRALLREVPRGTSCLELQQTVKYRNCWINLRTEIENFMVAITLYLIKTMLDD